LGKPKDEKLIVKDPMELISKTDVGYIEDSKNVPTHCGNCEYYSEKNGSGNCGRVKSPIYSAGCCNKWEPK
jgi:hypothetical protein